MSCMLSECPLRPACLHILRFPPWFELAGALLSPPPTCIPQRVTIQRPSSLPLCLSVTSTRISMRSPTYRPKWSNLSCFVCKLRIASRPRPLLNPTAAGRFRRMQAAWHERGDGCGCGECSRRCDFLRFVRFVNKNTGFTLRTKLTTIATITNHSPSHPLPQTKTQSSPARATIERASGTQAPHRPFPRPNHPVSL
jgi:hypothetical protein